MLKNLSYKLIVVLLSLIILASNFVYFLNLGTYYKFELKLPKRILRDEMLVRHTCNINFQFRYYLDGSSNQLLEIQAKNQPEAQKFFNDLIVCINNFEN
jgi:hypothetical protein